MTSLFRRIIGLLLILTAIGGLVISLYGLLGVWRFKPVVTESLTNAVVLTNDTLEATSAGLSLTEESLSAVVDSMQALQDALITTSEALNSTEPIFETAVAMLDEELPNTIEATQSSLESAQASAEIIDSFLKVISRIPFINVNYNPEKPLHESLGDISNNLGEFPAAFTKFSDSMEDAQDQLQVLQVDLEMMSDAVGQIETSLSESEAVIEQYQETVDAIQAQLGRIDQNIPAWVSGVAWGATFFLVWMAFAQIGLFAQGLELFGSTSQQDAEAAE